MDTCQYINYFPLFSPVMTLKTASVDISRIAAMAYGDSDATMQWEFLVKDL